jgi:pyruvate,water dikinase
VPEGNKDPIWFLKERAKELSCLYRVEDLLRRPDAGIEEVCNGIVAAIPPGWQYPDVCHARIVLEDGDYRTPGFVESPWKQTAAITVQDVPVGEITVVYTKEMPPADDGAFLNEETQLLATIADRLGHFIGFRRMKRVFEEIQSARADLVDQKSNEWRVIVKLLQRTDKDLYQSVSHKMLNQLLWKGIAEAGQLLEEATGLQSATADRGVDDNRPLMSNVRSAEWLPGMRVFEIAARYLGDDGVLASLQRWIQEDRLSFLVDMASQNLPLADVKDAIRRYRIIAQDGIELPPASRRNIQVSLIRRFLSEQLAYINLAKDFIELDDFDSILPRVVATPGCCGKLGGKAAGLILASRILDRSQLGVEGAYPIRTPETWYVSSEVMRAFVRFNDLGEVTEQKYKPIDQVRAEYPRIIQTYKNSAFPPEIVQGLAMILDALEGKPLIVRSSSLLEDRVGASFAGKYKSLFLANQGSKEHRLTALTDAIAEVYASVMGPDPIEYRAERGLLDFQEEMAILIQEVIGTSIGDYFFPTFAGVAFSHNDFRWSARIKQQDGLARLVPGLGTRAVDRVADDYPVLVAPGQPRLRVNATVSEMVQYSPTHMDVINLKTNSFETVPVSDLLKRHGREMTGVGKILSVYDGQHIRQPIGMAVDFDTDELVVTFDGMVKQTAFFTQLGAMLRLLEEKINTPIDIEFAFDGGEFYLLQCRAQSYAADAKPANIPADIPQERIVFSANRYVTNGMVGNVTHVVYVDPERYAELGDRQSLLAVGRAVGKLNTLLPKRQFVLVGPGRWGSRGEIKLGVSVTYSDISNTALLVEIARKKGDYVPDLSFGTHFFQDLVEANIRYLPLYPDDAGVVFNESFFRESPNMLGAMLPEYDYLADTVRVIDVPESAGGFSLQVLMNGDRDEAVAVLGDAGGDTVEAPSVQSTDTPVRDDAWRWRLEMAEAVAAQIDAGRFGVEAMYVAGSTKNATAGPCSDIDLLIHWRGTQRQREELVLWLEGWSKCLDEINYLKTGHRTGGILDVHIITDEDIEKGTSFAVKIGAVTDAARVLPVGDKGTQWR